MINLLEEYFLGENYFIGSRVLFINGGVFHLFVFSYFILSALQGNTRTTVGGGENLIWRERVGVGLVQTLANIVANTTLESAESENVNLMIFNTKFLWISE